MKAEACQLLADLTPEASRHAYWNEQADYWYELAAKAAKGCNNENREKSSPARLAVRREQRVLHLESAASAIRAAPRDSLLGLFV